MFLCFYNSIPEDLTCRTLVFCVDINSDFVYDRSRIATDCETIWTIQFIINNLTNTNRRPNHPISWFIREDAVQTKDQERVSLFGSQNHTHMLKNNIATAQGCWTRYRARDIYIFTFVFEQIFSRPEKAQWVQWATFNYTYNIVRPKNLKNVGVSNFWCLVKSIQSV